MGLRRIDGDCHIRWAADGRSACLVGIRTFANAAYGGHNVVVRRSVGQTRIRKVCSRGFNTLCVTTSVDGGALHVVAVRATADGTGEGDLGVDHISGEARRCGGPWCNRRGVDFSGIGTLAVRVVGGNNVIIRLTVNYVVVRVVRGRRWGGLGLGPRGCQPFLKLTSPASPRL